jgi:outer membrane protein assembly factor BamB
MLLQQKTPLILSLFTFMGVAASADDWPQWRGPHRSGLSESRVVLINSFGKEGPKRLWKSKDIPGHWGGGWGSLSISEDRVYVFSNPTVADPSQGMIVPEDTMNWWGWHPDPMPKILVEKIEALGESEALNKMKRPERASWVEAWIDKEVKRRHRKFANAIKQRLNRGKKSFKEAELRKLDALVDKVFKDQADAKKWFKDQGFDDTQLQSLIQGIKAKTETSHDQVDCIDARTGAKIWKTKFPGTPSNFRCSSTPTITQGKCLVLGSGGLVYCLDAKTGAKIWTGQSRAKPKETVASSFLVFKNKALVIAGSLLAFDIDTGKELWTQDQVKGIYSSPVLWQKDGQTLILCHSKKTVVAVNPADGQVLWTCAGAGGLSTPSIRGDVMVLVGKSRRQGLLAFDLTLKGAKEKWKVPFADSGCSAIIDDGYVYAFGGSADGGRSRALCVKVDTGKVLWDEVVSKSEFSSPVRIGTHVFTALKSSLLMARATPKGFKKLGEAALNITPCTSPSFYKGRLYLRLKDSIACFEIRSAS